MKSRKTSYPPINIGTSFMLAIFVILCMVIFAVLSLSSSMKDYEYSVNYADRTSAYYEACNEAEEIRKQIESENTQEDLIEYSVPIDENQMLHVVLVYEPDEASNYKIQSWTQETDNTWSGTQTLPVLGSN